MQEKVTNTAPNPKPIGGAQSVTNANKCEGFVSRLKKTNYPLYKEFVACVKSANNTTQPEIFFEQLKEIFQNRNDVLSDLNKVLAAEARVPIIPREPISAPPEIKEGDSFETKTKNLIQWIFKQTPSKMKQFMDQFKLYAHNKDYISWLGDAKLIFKEEPEIYDYIYKILSPEIDKVEKQKEQDRLNQIKLQEEQQRAKEEEERKRIKQEEKQKKQQEKLKEKKKQEEEQKRLLQQKQEEEQLLAKQNLENQTVQPVPDPNTVQTGKNIKKIGKKERKNQIKAQQLSEKSKPDNTPINPYQKPTHIQTNSNQMISMHQQQGRENNNGFTKSELAIFIVLENCLGQEGFLQANKLFHLYTKCIISSKELLDILNGVLIKKDFKPMLLESYQNILKDVVLQREEARRQDPVNVFKPLCAIDFTTCKRHTVSYVDMPEHYSSYCSNSDKISKSVLNTTIVNVTYGSEQNFHVKRKNQYEENMFKSEDDKYEYDLQIVHLKRVVDIFNNKDLNNLKLRAKYINEIFDYKGFVGIFRSDLQRQHDNLINDFNNTFPQLKQKVTEKYKEMVEHRNNVLRKNYHENSEKNFHRALDHRSFHFKNSDKKITSYLRFEKEIEFRYKNVLGKIEPDYVNKDEFIMDKSSYFKIHNSYEQLTNTEKCDHAEGEKKTIFNTINWKEFPEQQYLPLLTYYFDDKQVLHEAYSILISYTYYFGNNAAEKEKVRNTLHTFMQSIFQLQFKPLSEEFDETLDYENQIIKSVGEIENKIFDKICSYMVQQLYKALQDKLKEEEEYERAHPGIQRQDSVLSHKIGNKDIYQKNKTIQEEGNEEEDEEEEKEDLEIEEESKNLESETDLDSQQPQQNEKSQEENISIPKKKMKGSGVNQDENNTSEDDSKSKTQQQDEMSEDQTQIQEEEEQEIQENQKSQRQKSLRKQTINYLDYSDAYSEDQEHTQELTQIQRKSIRPINNKNKLNELKYLPVHDKDTSLVLYGTGKFQVILRLFYSIYERIKKAKEISTFFEKNSKTDEISESEKQEISKERYRLFKLILFSSFRIKDSTRIEDFYRSLFGNQAYLMFQIDKVFQQLCKQVTSYNNDELSKQMLDLSIDTEEKKYIANNTIDEALYMKSQNLMLQYTNEPSHRNMYRFIYEQTTGLIYVNFVETGYKNWETQPLNLISTSFYYDYVTPCKNQKLLVDNCSNNGPQYVFLQRNKQKMERKIDQKLCYNQNNIDFTCAPNNSQLLPVGCKNEDVFISNNRLKRKRNVQERIKVEYKKNKLFNKWLKKKDKF